MTLKAMEASAASSRTPTSASTGSTAALAQIGDILAREPAAESRPKPGALRPREAEGTGKGEEGDAFRGETAAPVLAARTSGTWTTGSVAEPTLSRSWTTTRVRSFPAPSPVRRTSPRLRRSTPPWSATGSPEALVTDGGGFRATQARSVYGALGITKRRDRARQAVGRTTIETNTSTSSEGWPTGTSPEQRAGPNGNPERTGGSWRTITSRPISAHQGRDDGRRSPAEVLGFASGVRHRAGGAEASVLLCPFVRVLDSFGLHAL